ncbi:D-alanine--D-alanine ligase [Patescibacteria group bacterium]|nr:D-alanine--D-alanine ligase [Patescibacteria group bacterium]
MRKLKVAILFGGRSAEHEVSSQSAKNVLAALDRKKYAITPLLIPKNGKFNFEQLKKFDVVFPVLHGTNGEDGTMQGLLKILNIPFVGAGVLGSAVGMDKEVQKRLLRDAGIPTAKFQVFDHRPLTTDYSKVKYPCFVKPANTGSSVGISKVHNQKELAKATKLAFQYDRKILIEETIDGRELEISVLGNENPIASLPGEVLPSHEFYDYDAKYISPTKTEIPARITKKQITKIQDLAIKTYKVLCCEGMARVDMFLKPNGEVLINEINTIPGFTNISMYPKLWEVSGLPYSKLLDKLITLALDRNKSESALKSSYKI